MPASRSFLKAVASRVPGVAGLVRERDELRRLLDAARVGLDQAGTALAAAMEQFLQEAAAREAAGLAADQARDRAEAAEQTADQARDRAEAAIEQLQARLDERPQEFTPADQTLAGLRFSRPAQLAAVLDVELLARRAPGHEQALLANLGNTGPFATFLRNYMTLDTGATSEALRFALVVELVLQLGGTDWVDLGSLGHDAAYIAMLHPDLRAKLYSLQGGRVGIYPDGYWHASADRPEPLASAFIEALDFESQPLPLESGSTSLVTAFEVFEHFKFGPQQCMLEINRVLQTGGRLVLTVPNAASAGALWKVLHGEHPSLCSLYHRIPQFGRIHPSEYVSGQLRGLVQAFGFEVEVLTGYSAGDYASHERKAIGWCLEGNFRGAMEGDDDFGVSLLLVATKIREASELSYPESLFERPDSYFDGSSRRSPNRH